MQHQVASFFLPPCYTLLQTTDLFRPLKCSSYFCLVHHWMKELWQDSICMVVKPHVHIYLDCPIEIVKERIAKRGNVSEIHTCFIKDTRAIHALEAVLTVKNMFT